MASLQRKDAKRARWLALSHPVVATPLLGSGLLFAGLALTQRLTIVLPLAVLALVTGLVAWAIVARLAVRHAAEGASLAASLPDRAPATAEDAKLAADLRRLLDVPDLAEVSRQATRQLEQLAGKLAAIHGALSVALAPGELTRARYLGATERLADALRASLRQMVLKGDAAAAIDGAYAATQIQRLATTPGTAAGAERAALTERLVLRAACVAAARELVGKNEAALTALTKLTVALDGFAPETERGFGLESAARDLEDLAARVRLYAESAARD